MAKRDRNRQQALRHFVDLCHRVGFELEPFQVKIAGALLGPEREKLITLPRKNGKSRVIGTFAAWHLLTTPQAQVIVVANSKEQAEIIDKYARQVAMHPLVEREFEPRFRELRGPDGSTLQVKSADAGRLLGLTPTLAIYDEFCVAKDDAMYTALRSALLPGSTMFTVTTAGWGAESPLGRLRAPCLAQPDIRPRGFLTDARGPNIRMLEWMVPEDVELDDFQKAKQANPLSLITPGGSASSMRRCTRSTISASTSTAGSVGSAAGCRPAAGRRVRTASVRRKALRSGSAWTQLGIRSAGLRLPNAPPKA